LPAWAYTAGAFLLLLAGGSLLLMTRGVLEEGLLSAADAVLLATSAVTLTGLSPVAASPLSRYGQTLLLVLVQLAGIGIITVSTMYLAVPGIHHARGSRQVVRQRWLEVEQLHPGRVLGGVVLMSLAAEALGALILLPALRAASLPDAGFSAVFLAVSAFCNAGFVPHDDVMQVAAASAPVLIALLFLITLGALGFVVLRDVTRRLSGAKKTLDLHTRLVLLVTVALTASGAAYLFVCGSGPASGGWPAGLLRGLFQAVNARTAGFGLTGQTDCPAAQALTGVLMLVGGAPGSAAGGLRITAVLLVLLAGLRGMGPRGVVLRDRSAPAEATEFAVVFVLRALLLLAGAVLLLCTTETLFNRQAGLSFGQLLFEAVSAFTTAGLSTGVTPLLSGTGKAVLTLTMLVGRFGLLAMVGRMSLAPRGRETVEVHRQGEVVIG
jgi:trk system potassium uptake protein TrkH